jgi:ribose 1,5-bisphosphokinase
VSATSGNTRAAGIGPGAFIAVVGASGVGKDALMAYAREQLGGEAHFPRRVISRPAGPAEDFEPIDERGFAEIAAAGGFAMSWNAHGLAYGIRVTVDEHIRAGHAVVANVSRAVLEPLSRRYERLLVVRIVVSDEVRGARLRNRGRETTEDIEARLARTDPAPDFPMHAEIRNDGTHEQGGRLLLELIAANLSHPGVGQGAPAQVVFTDCRDAGCNGV